METKRWMNFVFGLDTGLNDRSIENFNKHTAFAML